MKNEITRKPFRPQTPFFLVFFKTLYLLFQQKNVCFRDTSTILPSAYDFFRNVVVATAAAAEEEEEDEEEEGDTKDEEEEDGAEEEQKEEEDKPQQHIR